MDTVYTPPHAALLTDRDGSVSDCQLLALRPVSYRPPTVSSHVERSTFLLHTFVYAHATTNYVECFMIYTHTPSA